MLDGVDASGNASSAPPPKPVVTLHPLLAKLQSSNNSNESKTLMLLPLRACMSVGLSIRRLVRVSVTHHGRLHLKSRIKLPGPVCELKIKCHFKIDEDNSSSPK